MKLLHVGDLHLGKRLGEYDLLEDQKYLLDQITELCRKCGADALLISGDIYDKSVPSVTAVELLDHFLTELIRQGTPVFLISGNHDSAERLNFGSRLLEKSGLHIAGEFQGSLTKITLQDEYGPVQIWSLPFVKAVGVRHYLPEADTATYDAALTAALGTASMNCRERNILLAHQFVTWGANQPVFSGSEMETVTVGMVDNVDCSCFDAFDYVALGHIHRAQPVGRETVRYAGSPMKYSISEIDSEKSAVLITLREKENLEIKLIPLKPLREMRHITGPLKALLKPEHVENPEDYIWVTLTDEEPILDAIGQVKSVYPRTIKLDYQSRMSRSAEPGNRSGQIRKKSFEELFGEFYETVTGNPPNSEEWRLVEEARQGGREEKP